MKITIPPTSKKWSQANLGDIFGVIYGTYGIDFHSKGGRALPSQRIYQRNNTSDDAQLTNPGAFLRTSADNTDRWWALCPAGLFKTADTNPSDGWLQDAIASSPTDMNASYSDMIDYEGSLIVSTEKNLHRLTAGTWYPKWWASDYFTIGAISNTSPIEITTTTNHDFSTGNSVVISGTNLTDGTFNIHSTAANKFTLDGSLGLGVTGSGGKAQLNVGLTQSNLTTNIHPMDTFQRLFLIGDGQYMHMIDRNSHVFINRLTFPAEYTVSFIRHGNDKVWIGLDNIKSGRCAVAEWDGYSETYLRIHILEGTKALSCAILADNPHIVTDYGCLYINNGATFQTAAYFPIFNERLVPSGEDYYPNQWSNSGRTVHWNGMAVIDDKVHILASGNVLDLKLVKENMKGGIWCYDKDTGLYHRFSLSNFKTGDTVTKDFGNALIMYPGALVSTNIKSASLLLAGASYSTDGASGTNSAIFISNAFNDLLSQGTFITTKMESPEIAEQFNKIWPKFRKLLNATDRIVVKYRSSDSERLALPYRIQAVTWTAGNVFTTTSAGIAQALVGDEVDITAGPNTGYTAHILSITLLAGTYTVTIDETLPTTSGAGQVVIRDWKKLDTITSQTIEYKDIPIPTSASWIQIKIELRGYRMSPELEQMILFTKPQVTSED
jgi:hypothetical protein